MEFPLGLRPQDEKMYERGWNAAIKAAENIAMEEQACFKSAQPHPVGEAIWKKLRMLRSPAPNEFAR